jgi:hypothetical protein
MADDINGTVRARTVTMLDPHLGDLSDFDEIRLILRAACYAMDLVEVGQASSLDEAVRVAVVQLGADATRQLRVRALAQDLSTAASGDIAAQLTVFSACETV